MATHPYLSVIYLSSLPPGMTDEQSLNAGILDLATHQECGTQYRCCARWALTPPFHPCRQGGGYFLSLYSDVTADSPWGGWCSVLPGLSSRPLQAGRATDLRSRNVMSIYYIYEK